MCSLGILLLIFPHGFPKILSPDKWGSLESTSVLCVCVCVCVCVFPRIRDQIAQYKKKDARNAREILEMGKQNIDNKHFI